MSEKFHDVTGLDFDGEVMVLRADGNTYHIDLGAISPRLARASDSARKFYRISPSGYGIHWPEVDEDLSLEGLIHASRGQAKTEQFSALKEEPTKRKP
jgi:hypothetical protein